MKKPISLFAATDVHALHGESKLGAVLSLILNDPDAVNPEAVLLGGDLVGGLGRAAPPGGPNPGGPVLKRPMTPEQLRDWVPEFAPKALRAELLSLLGPSTRIFFTYGSHDKNALGGSAGFFHGGAALEHCCLYGVSFCQMRYADDEQLAASGYDGPDAPLGGAARGAAEFTAWTDSLPDRKPLFVMSHIPLHAHRADNPGALEWARAFDRAAQRRDVFVFFGHNHTAEHLSPLERQCYFVPAGGALTVQGNKKEEQPTLSPRFTYLNAGYIVNGCGTLLTLSDGDGDGRYDTLTIRRYCLDGAEPYFGSTRFANPRSISLGYR